MCSKKIYTIDKKSISIDKVNKKTNYIDKEYTSIDIGLNHTDKKLISIKAENISKYFEDRYVIENLNFEIDNSRPVCLMGPSGVGKTTLLRIISGLDSPSSGDIKYLIEKDGNTEHERKLFGNTIDKTHIDVSIDDRKIEHKSIDRNIDDEKTVYKNIEIYKNPKNIYKHIPISCQFQESRLFPHMTILDNLKISLPYISIEDIIRIASIILTEEELNTKVSNCSGGMKRRCEIARAVMYNSKIAIFDEPFSFLDPLSRDNCIKLIKEFCKDRLVVFSSHDERDAIDLDARVVHLG